MSAIAESIEREWKAFQEANDERLSEIEQHGQVSAETAQKVERINDAISELQEQLREVENHANRQVEFTTGVLMDDEQRMAYAHWQSMVTRQPVEPEQVDIELVDRYQKAFNDYARHGAQASPESIQFLNVMSVGSDADGGYWVDPDTSGRLATLVYETSPIRQLASVQVISTDALEGTVDLGEAGSGWVGETQPRNETGTPQVGTWRIPVHEQYAEPRATQKLLDDARVDVEGWLAGKVSGKFGRSENTAFVTGDGNLKPRGFMTYTAGTPSASAWDVIEQVNSGGASALTSDGIVDLVFALKSAYRMGAVFGMNRSTEAAVRKLKDGQDNYLWQPDFTQRTSATLVGFPIIEMPDLADIASSALPVVFGNFAEGYQIVDRMGIRVLRDPYTTKGWVKFYSTKRVGGGVVNFEALKVQKVSA